MEDIEFAATDTFYVRSVHDVFRKLARERMRFEHAKNRQDMTDTAINFAVTAWHMTDWAWRLRTVKGHFPEAGQSKKLFQELMRKRSRDLAVCDVIANGFKHGGSAFRVPSHGNVDTILIARTVGDGTISLEVRRDPEWTLKVRVDGRATHARSLFYKVNMFWSRFIQSYCIAH